MESIQQFEINGVVFHIATGEQRCYIIVCYLAPNNTLMIESAIAELKERLWGAELLVTGDLNINLNDTEVYFR